MENLIKRMENEGMNTAVIKDWYKEFKDCLNKCKSLSENGQVYVFSEEYEKSNRLYGKLYGALWGFVTIGYISLELKDRYIDELIDSFRF